MTTTPTIDLAATGRNIQKLRIRAGVTVRELQLALVSIMGL